MSGANITDFVVLFGHLENFSNLLRKVPQFDIFL